MKKKTIKRILLTCGIVGIGTASVLVLRNVNDNLKKEANIEEKIERVGPTLNDVFLKLTGKELRD